MTTFTKFFAVAFVAVAFVFATSNQASAQYPVTYTTVQPAVVGYTAEPAGLFGFRTAYRPIVSNVPVTTTVTATPAPVVSYRPATYVAPAAVTVPVTSYYAPSYVW